MISRTDYYKALGLFTLARAAYIKCEEYEDALHEMLELEPGNFISDAVAGRENFEWALKREGIEVE